MSRRSPIHQLHLELGGRMVEFGGWDMPLQFEGVVAEHTAVRQRVGLFDVSHLGKIVVTGARGEGVLDELLPGKVAQLPEWRAGYNLVLNERGGVVDDIFVYRRPESFVVVPNAANFDAVFQVISEAASQRCEVSDARERWAILALSGPRARHVAQEVLPEDVLDLKLHRFANAAVDGAEVQVARTGYTGEYTFELFVEWGRAPDLWKALLDAGQRSGIAPCGLGARDTLRLEMGYPLHGHDITPETNPIEAGLDWVIEWDKDFPAREALQEIKAKGPERKLTGLVAEGRGIPREGCAVRYGSRKVGVVTSGNFSPVLRKGIALGYLARDAAEPGTKVAVEVRGRHLDMEVVKPPFIDS